jgi:hypothetical protein
MSTSGTFRDAADQSDPDVQKRDMQIWKGLEGRFKPMDLGRLM